MGKLKIDNNVVSASSLVTPLTAVTTSEEFVLKDVRENYVYVDGKRTDEKNGYTLSVADPDTFAMLHIKAEKIDFEMDIIEKSEDPVFVSIPTDQCNIIPYKIEFGKANVSIVAPYAKLAEE